MNKTRVRVEAKRLPQNATRQEREYNLVKLLRIFKRACNDYGVMHSFKEHEFFVRKCDVRRRKRIAKLAASRQEFTTDQQQYGDYNGEKQRRFDG
jgi:ribosomal protein S21